MTTAPQQLTSLWRVGYHQDPVGFTPHHLYAYNHRFDDVHRRFRTLYCAETPETSLREVLTDFRPNLAAQQRHIERYGPEAAEDFVPESVTAEWRRKHVLVPVTLHLDGPLVDLTEAASPQLIEDRHVELLVAHGLQHLDLHEITCDNRLVTQTIAADLYDQGVAAVRFPSRRDGDICIALIEERGSALVAGPALALTDPPPAPLDTVTKEWRLKLERT